MLDVPADKIVRDTSQLDCERCCADSLQVRGEAGANPLATDPHCLAGDLQRLCPPANREPTADHDLSMGGGRSGGGGAREWTADHRTGSEAGVTAGEEKQVEDTHGTSRHATESRARLGTTGRGAGRALPRRAQKGENCAFGSSSASFDFHAVAPRSLEREHRGREVAPTT